MAEPEWTIGAGRVQRWDVTRAVREAITSKGGVNLLIRVCDMGKYVAGAGHQFHGPGAAEIERRPQLRLIDASSAADR